MDLNFTSAPGGFIDNKTQEKRHQRTTAELKIDYTFSRNFSDVWRRIQKRVWIWTSSKCFQPYKFYLQAFFDFFIRLCEQTAVSFHNIHMHSWILIRGATKWPFNTTPSIEMFSVYASRIGLKYLSTWKRMNLEMPVHVVLPTIVYFSIWHYTWML